MERRRYKKDSGILKVSVIGDEDTVTGFRLAGVKETQVIEDNSNLEQAFEEIEDDVGVIVLTERIAEKRRDYIESYKKEKDVFPILVEIPDKKGSVKKTELTDLIKKAIGIDLDVEDIEKR